MTNTGAGAPVRFSLTPAESARADALAERWLKRAKGSTIFEPGRGDPHKKRTKESARARVGLVRCLGGNDTVLPSNVRVRYVKQAGGHLILGRRGDRPAAWFLESGRNDARVIVGWLQWSGEPGEFDQDDLRRPDEFPGWVGPGDGLHEAG